MLHVLARDLAVAVHVQLQEERLPGARRVQDVVERARRERRDLHVRACARERARGGSKAVSAFGFAMEGGEAKAEARRSRTIWMTFVLAAARVSVSSPSGWPSLPRAVAD